MCTLLQFLVKKIGLRLIIPVINNFRDVTNISLCIKALYEEQGNSRLQQDTIKITNSVSVKVIQKTIGIGK